MQLLQNAKFSSFRYLYVGLNEDGLPSSLVVPAADVRENVNAGQYRCRSLKLLSLLDAYNEQENAVGP